MKKIIYNIALVIAAACVTTSCFNLDEEVYDRVDAGIYYQDESSVKGAVASIYGAGALAYIEYFWYLQEFSADQIAWRSWNGGLWGYDEGQKTVLSTHTWTPESVIIRQSWEGAWTTIGLCNTLINDLQSLDAASMGMTTEKMDMYISEVRTLRAWSYYNLFEIWGGVLPLYTSVGTDVPPSASTDFDEGCKLIYDFIMTELDESLENLATNEVNRMNKAVNRVIKARLLLNSQVFIGENHYTECAAVCQDIINGKFGTYSLASDYRDIYSIGNVNCPEVIMAFSFGVGHLDGGWMRNMTFLPYNIDDYFDGGTYGQGTWNCVILSPSYDNSGTVIATGGTENPVGFLDAPYNDKLGAVYERFHNSDIRKQNIVGTRNGTYDGMFLKGAIKANFGRGDALKADADRDGQNLVYVDQVGTFMNLGRNLETVMSPRWGETNSGIRLVKYPMYPEAAGIDFRDIDEVEFRLAEVVYMLAECKLRAGDTGGAKTLVNSVRQRYFVGGDWATAQDDPGHGFSAFDEDWMLNQWGQEFLNEGRRRRTDLRRFDKFTQGQWWFFGRATDDGKQYPAVRDRKYEWFPLPATALSVNPGLVQNPNY
uniref:Putative RagB-SusD domain-containing protein n=1 Tax=termite gut metagenome TaxID=433724 RepID=S0DDZ5_9ZZZZ